MVQLEDDKNLPTFQLHALVAVLYLDYKWIWLYLQMKFLLDIVRYPCRKIMK